MGCLSFSFLEVNIERNSRTITLYVIWAPGFKNRTKNEIQKNNLFSIIPCFQSCNSFERESSNLVVIRSWWNGKNFAGKPSRHSVANIIVGRFDPISNLSLQRALNITCTKSSHISPGREQKSMEFRQIKWLCFPQHTWLFHHQESGKCQVFQQTKFGFSVETSCPSLPPIAVSESAQTIVVKTAWCLSKAQGIRQKFVCAAFSPSKRMGGKDHVPDVEVPPLHHWVVLPESPFGGVGCHIMVTVVVEDYLVTCWSLHDWAGHDH